MVTIILMYIDILVSSYYKHNLLKSSSMNTKITIVEV
jgi:hypothetical protein